MEKNLAEEMNKENQVEQKEKSFFDELDEEAIKYEKQEEERKQKEAEERHEQIKKYIKVRCWEVAKERQCRFSYDEYIPHTKINISDSEFDEVAKELKLKIKFEGRAVILSWPKRLTTQN
ncbi:MAG: hypothetical protein K2H53_01345 [Clostridia bacterium]|nr:hypothetical protein [Clostridia bacterium]